VRPSRRGGPPKGFDAGADAVVDEEDASGDGASKEEGLLDGLGGEGD